MRTIVSQIKRLKTLDEHQLVAESKNLAAPLHLIQQVAEKGKLPVPILLLEGLQRLPMRL